MVADGKMSFWEAISVSLVGGVLLLADFYEDESEEMEAKAAQRWREWESNFPTNGA